MASPAWATTSSGGSEGSRLARPAARGGDALPDRVVDQLEGLAEPGSLVRRQRDRVGLARVLQPLAAPHLPADLDDLPGTADRGVIGPALPALRHPWSRR